jgi:tetratricopeptide (TPR) repeat protein
MRNTIISVFCLIFAAATTATCQSFTVEYLDGAVDLMTTKGWSGLSLGDSVGADANIRISKGGMVELFNATLRISIVKEGTYLISAILKAGKSSGQKGLGASLAQKLHLLTAGWQGAGEVGGIRGAQAGNSGDLEYVDEYTMTWDTVSGLFASGKYTEAIPLLVRAKTDASGLDEQADFGYLLAVAYYNSGETAQAYRAISTLSVDPRHFYYPDYVILKAQVLLDGFAYQDALSILTPFIASRPQPSFVQIALLLSAQCSRGLGDEKGAQDALAKGYLIDPKSETATLIGNMQKQ